MRRLRPGRREWLTAAVTAYGVVAVVIGCLLLWGGLEPVEQSAVAAAAMGQAAMLAVVEVVALAGFVALVYHLLGRYPTTARRLTAETRLLLYANPAHRLAQSGPSELVELAAAVNELAEQRSAAERHVAAEVALAQANLEQERNRLATLMSELAVAVLVCTAEGRILLYNAAARLLVADDAAVGLGRSVFGIVDRGLFAYAVDRMTAGSSDLQVTTTLRGGQILQVHLGAVLGPEREITGFVLLLDDLTDRLQTSDRSDALLRELTEGTRASLGSIQAAIETVVDYPDMDFDDRNQFLAIIRDETHGLGRQVQRWVLESAAFLGADWLLTEINGPDLLEVVGRAVERDAAVQIQRQAPVESMWVKADSHAVAQAIGYLVGRLHGENGVVAITLGITQRGRHGQLEIRWEHGVPDPEVFQSWLSEPMAGGAETCVRRGVERHGGEIWCDETPDGGANLRFLLPLADSAPMPTAEALSGKASAADTSSDVISRPEFYDFQLFDRPDEAARWTDRALGDIEYTVFDTETTGLDPTRGDEIISMGAVRVVNGRLLRQETFERLVDPERSVPKASTAVHGITGEMVAGKPTIDVVLPDFARYAQESVLVGHNVGFDMQFLRLKEQRAGVTFTQPVLDTLLLDAVVHPDHDEHSLEAIAARLGVDVLGRHTALGDAIVTGEVFLRLLALLPNLGITTLGEAMEASRTTLQARLDQSMYGQRESRTGQRKSLHGRRSSQ